MTKKGLNEFGEQSCGCKMAGLGGQCSFIWKNSLSLSYAQLVSIPSLFLSLRTCYRTQIIGGVVHKIPITPQAVRTPPPPHPTPCNKCKY